MTERERAEFLDQVVEFIPPQELWRRLAGRPVPGIESAEAVCGGDACIAGTRIPVWLLEALRRLGTGEPAILADFPALQRADLANAWLYASLHPGEIDDQIRANANA